MAMMRVRCHGPTPETNALKMLVSIHFFLLLTPVLYNNGGSDENQHEDVLTVEAYYLMPLIDRSQD
jgi:hypothetical protein